MLNITEQDLEKVRDHLADATPTAIGYRLMIRPLPADKTMAGLDKKKFETLAASGFTDKTSNEASRQTYGSDVGVVVSIGQDAYSVGNLKDTQNWCAVGDVVIFPRYSGHRCEMPPGSGEHYHFMNDDDIVGRYEGVKL